MAISPSRPGANVRPHPLLTFFSFSFSLESLRTGRPVSHLKTCDVHYGPRRAAPNAPPGLTRIGSQCSHAASQALVGPGTGGTPNHERARCPRPPPPATLRRSGPLPTSISRSPSVSYHLPPSDWLAFPRHRWNPISACQRDASRLLGPFPAPNHARRQLAGGAMELATGRARECDAIVQFCEAFFYPICPPLLLPRRPPTM